MWRLYIWVCVVSLVISGISQGATIYVLKDGSGDYRVIQDAMNVAVSGDTIQIGPGWFQEYQVYSYPGGDFPIYVNKTVPDLTLIGSGEGETFIGPWKEDTWGLERSYGISSQFTIEDGVLVVSDLSVMNVWNGFNSTSGSAIFKHCSFEACSYGVFTQRPFEIYSSNFIENTQSGLHSNIGTSRLVVESCSFEGDSGGLNIIWTPDVSIRGCSFLNCEMGALITGSSGEMLNCTVIGSTYQGVELSGVYDFLFAENEISSVYFNLLIGSCGESLVCEDNIFYGTDIYGIRIIGSTPQFRNNHIFKGVGYSVVVGGFPYEPDVIIDMKNNYWGTSSPDSISAWIQDGNDSNSNHGYVEFNPIADGPVPTDKTTLDDLKAMYR